MPAHQTAEIDWHETGVPVSRRFEDPYFSLEDGWAEAGHVFLAGNGLPGRFRTGFHIAELGFGSGLNMLAALDAWRASGLPGPLRYTGFEAFPMTDEAAARAIAPFPRARALAATLPAGWQAGGARVATDEIELELIVGDARRTLPAWRGRADAWFLDGFAPARNPELWTSALLAEVARHTAPGGTVATYSAAGAVRRGLADAGFAVDRRPGFGRKRHMTVGALPA